ncbi:formate hydrogenlyase complex 3 iron-sulfur protein [Klebsiella oxytoca]|nr:formate hydrogenlyase complex 3 iron-sulfur protein [Klebsiella oxytoca]
MFTFIKKVIKTGTATHSYPLEPMPVDKNFRGKPEHNPQQCIGCAACVNACPSNALTVENRSRHQPAGVAVQPRALHFLRALRRGLPDGGD